MLETVWRSIRLRYIHHIMSASTSWKPPNSMSSIKFKSFNRFPTVRCLATNSFLSPVPNAASTSFTRSYLNNASSGVSSRYFAAFQKPSESDFIEEGNKNSSRYAWVDEEAQDLIKKAYARHNALADKSQSFPPSLSVADLERVGVPYHYPPKDFVDSLAFNLMRVLRTFVHGFFREKYDHHAVCLETVAAVPGIVASFHRHLRSLRRMQRDHGWIGVLLEECENERMHLLIFMQVCQPTVVERALVVMAQGLYLSFYSTLYLVNSRAAHRLTGYLEEEAFRAYTDYLQSIDEGKIPNRKAPEIARNYYHLDNNATMRDVILHVRADEAMHRDVNHRFGDKYAEGDVNSPLDETQMERAQE